MKKLLFSIIALCFALSATAQDDMQPMMHKSVDFQYGLKAGMVFTTYSSDSDDFQAHFGNWGFICRFKSENWAIQPELHYATQGVRSLIYKVRKGNSEYDTFGKIPAINDAVTAKFRLHMLTYNLQMPVIAKWYMPVQNLKGINIQAGPKVGYICDYKVSAPTVSYGYLISDEFGTEGRIRRFARDMRKVTLAADFGAGYDSKTGIGFDLRCSMGILPVFKGEKQNIFKNPKDRVWSFAFTYVF